MSTPKAKKAAVKEGPSTGAGGFGTSSAAEPAQVFEFFAPAAISVAVAASFNDWSLTATTLSRDKSGKWSASVKLAPGSYEYRFVVDGEWQNDQRPVPSVRNPFGGWNCLLIVSHP